MNILLLPVYLLQSGQESGLESGLESSLESGLESDVDSDLESDLESGLVCESSKVINRQLKQLKEANKELRTEVEDLLRDKKEFKHFLQQQVTNLVTLQICHRMIPTKKKLSLHLNSDQYHLSFYNNVQC